jgi:hypothetical protein
VDGVGGLGDGGNEQFEGGPGGRGGVRTGGAVEADDGVEVDHAAALVFGDLGKTDPQLRGQVLVRQPGLAGDGPAEGDGEAPPELGGAGVEQDRAGVVVAVRAQRLTEPVIVEGVPVRAGHAPAMGQIRARRLGRHRWSRPSLSRERWTGPKEGAVSVVNTHGWVATLTPLPPESPARMSW